MTRTVLKTLLAAVALASCAPGTHATTDEPIVVAAFYPLAEVAREIGGGAVRVVDLTPPGGEPHDLEMRPGDVRLIRDAGLILFLGGGFQPALEEAIDSLGAHDRAVDLLGVVELLEGEDPRGHEVADADPHIWLDPLGMVAIAERVVEATASLSPEDAEGFRTRAASYRDRLLELHREYEMALENCERREFFVSHAAFGYLAARYGLEQVAISGLSPESEPSPQRLREIAEEARALSATTIFFETLVGPRVAEVIAREVGAKTAVLDPIESISRERRPMGDDYATVMRSNLQGLSDGLGCGGTP